MEVVIILIIFVVVIIFLVKNTQETTKKKRILALYNHELATAQRFINDAERLKNLQPILERLNLAKEAVIRAKSYAKEEQTNYLNELEKKLDEVKDETIVENYKERMDNLFQKSETQVNFKTKINTLNKCVELHNQMKLDYPEQSERLVDLRNNIQRDIFKMTLKDFGEKAKKQEFLGKNNLAVKIWKEALWFIENSDLEASKKEKLQKDINRRIERLE